MVWLGPLSTRLLFYKQTKRLTVPSIAEKENPSSESESASKFDLGVLFHIVPLFHIIKTKFTFDSPYVDHRQLKNVESFNQF